MSEYNPKPDAAALLDWMLEEMPKTSIARSRTFKGIAEAMVSQWSEV
jgi:hypothetical protein